MSVKNNFKKLKVKSYFYLLVCNVFFPEVLTGATVGLIENGCNSQEKRWFVAEICLIWKLKRYTNDHRPNAPIIRIF